MPPIYGPPPAINYIMQETPSRPVALTALILNRFSGGKDRLACMRPANKKIQSAAMFNVTSFFLLSRKHMLERLQMMELAAGQSDHRCCAPPHSFIQALLITGSGKIVCDLCQGFFCCKTQRLAATVLALRHV